MPDTPRRNIGTIQVQRVEEGECPHIITCGFLAKYRSKLEIYCMGMERVYCKGAKQQTCARVRIFKQTGKFPSDDVSPSGDMLVAKG